jgi:hypothetical protein
MSAREENVSQNRRRLFKALSSAPVVATLSPGSALATHSAYQCAAGLRNDQEVSPGPNASFVGPFDQVQLMTWVLTTTDRQDRPETDNPRDLVELGGTGISVPQLNAGITVVSMDPDNPALGPFYELDGSNFEDRFDPTTVARVEVSGNVMTIYNQRTSGAWPNGRETLISTGMPMYFAKVYRTTNDPANPSCSQDCKIEPLGVFPQQQFTSGTQQVQAGQPQGMSGTCLGSFVDDGNINLTPP